MNLKVYFLFFTIICSLISTSENKLPIGKWQLEKSVCDEDQYLKNKIELEFNENGKGLIRYDKKDEVYFEWNMELDTLKFAFNPKSGRNDFILGAEKFMLLNGPFENQMSLKDVNSKCRWIFHLNR